MSGCSYRGRHRKPTHTARNMSVIGVTGALATVPMLITAGQADAGPAGGWNAVIACESGGDPTAQNRSSSASGVLQFIDSTWAGYGGTEFAAHAKDATLAEQMVVAERAYAADGLGPWEASRSCWAGSRSAPAAHKSWATAAKTVTGDRAADGSGTFVCAPDELYFDACDPGTLGQVEQFPLYD